MKDPALNRREFLRTGSGLAMAGGLLAGYGSFGGIAGRYLFPAHPQAKGWVFVATVDQLKPGDSLSFRTPAGARVAVARKSDTGTVEDFIALSSTCPHLGCQVHWEGQNRRFFCPCHNGSFDADGKATGGPPAEAGQSLPRFPLKVEGNLLYMEVPLA